jgi:V8-like Glu-specific endopeptidase
MGKELFEAAARAGVARASKALPQRMLRFTLVYKAKPSISVERRRLKALFGANGFQLIRTPFGKDPLVLVLQFPGIHRTQSTPYLISASYWLADMLDLDACSPDANPGWIAENEMSGASAESIGGAVWALCKSYAAAPVDPMWSIKAVRADKAWTRFKTTGSGIRIGQPDTGVAEHREIDEGLDLAAGTDIIAGGGPPIDPLLAHMSSPGHGTATSSVVASRGSGQIIGTAPNATVIPIRCVDGVVILSGAAVAAAIDHARTKKCDIVTLSLGGPFQYPEIRRAVKRATDAGMIVLAAAGNCVKFVVYPAWDENVIAVAAVDQDDRKWKGSSSGPKVDISAPGENVYVARRQTSEDTRFDLVEPGQGTSFAVTTTAGCAALWLAHHTRAKVRASAKSKGVSVQALFRAALRQTARRPAGWDSANMGTGIVDAEALLALALSKIDVTQPQNSFAHPALSEFGADFNWTRHGVEAGFLAFDRLQREDPERIGSLETAVVPRASLALTEAARRVGKGESALLRTPMVLDTLLTPQLRPGLALRTVVLASRGASVESGTGVTDKKARSYLEGTGRIEVLEAFNSIHETLTAQAETEVDKEGAALRKRILDLAPGILDRYAKGEIESTATLAGEERGTIEALIRLTGRPALRLTDGMVDLEDPQIGGWFGSIVFPRTEIQYIAQRVCRIDVEENGRYIHVGTGILVGPGVIMTNRHVMESFAETLPKTSRGPDFQMTANASIVFEDHVTEDSIRFKINAVIAAGAAQIGRYVDLTKLDMAFLSVETSNASGHLPDPIKPQNVPSKGDFVAVIGYPAQPNLSAAVDPGTGKVSEEMIDVLWKIYGTKWGVKYISPGEIMHSTGNTPGDGQKWAFCHDCTTLGGNSGSAVIRLSNGMISLCGLHFGGRPKGLNYAHDILAVKQRIVANPNEEVLSGATWPS